MYIVIAILAFGILIAVHELGHFMAAKAFGVKVNEYSIGMGPAILKKQGGETLYALRLLPIGGYCAMEGEDEDTGDERSFVRQSAWKKVIILVAGATMNFLLGFIIVLVLYSSAKGFYTTGITSVLPDSNAATQGLQAGDRIVKLNGHSIMLQRDVTLFLERASGRTVDLTVERDGKLIDLSIDLTAYPDETTGEERLMLGITMGEVEKATIGAKLKYSWLESIGFVRLVWMGLTDLVRGAVGLNEMSGVVGIVSEINKQGETAETTAIALENIAYLCAFIAVNLAVMNLLPIPALDGGRVFFLIIGVIVEKVFRKKVNPKVEAYIHAAGMVLLLGLMAVLVVSDILKLVR